jgi:hypothetical protein
MQSVRSFLSDYYKTEQYWHTLLELSILQLIADPLAALESLNTVKHDKAIRISKTFVANAAKWAVKCGQTLSHSAIAVCHTRSPECLLSQKEE